MLLGYGGMLINQSHQKIWIPKNLAGWERLNDMYHPVWFEGAALPENLAKEDDTNAENANGGDDDEDLLYDVQDAEWSKSSEEED